MQDPRVHVTKEELEGSPIPEEPIDTGFSLIVKDEDVEFLKQYFKDITPLSEVPSFTSFNRATRRKMIKQSKTNLGRLKDS
jgi:hypothetical protein